MMSSMSVETTSIAQACRDAIAEHRAEAERVRRLPEALVARLRDARAFALMTPVERDGLELSLAEGVDVLEAFGRLDGSVAWNVWNGNLGFAAALLDEDAADAIWAGDGDPIIANSARPSGRATSVAGGFALSGRWDIVSAIEIADWAALFAIVDDDPRDVRVFFVPREQVEVLDTWHTSGMRATGSHAVVAEGVRVPAALAVSPFAPARIDRPLYRIPAFTLASTGAAPVVIGVAQAALDEVAALAPAKALPGGGSLAEQPHLAARLGAAQTALDAARALLRDAAGAIDADAAAGRPIGVPPRARLRAAMSHAAVVGREALTTAYELASSSALYTDQALERLVRDGLVACQHGILARTNLDLRGRVMVGLDPGTPVL